MAGFANDAAHQVADEVRAIAEALVASRLDDTTARHTLRLLREARESLARTPAVRREKWTDSDYESWWSYLDRSVFGGGLNALSPHVAYDDPADVRGPTVVTGKLTLGPAYQGGPGMVHGGYIAGLFDHFLGCAQGPRGTDFTAVTVTLLVRYLRPTPLGEELTFRAWYGETDGRFLTGRATCHANSQLTAEAEGVFKKVDVERLRAPGP